MIQKIFSKALSVIMLMCILTLQPRALFAQQAAADLSTMTREEVLALPYEKLTDMPLDQLLQLADIVGVSLDELYEMILNKDIVAASKTSESSFSSPLSSTVVSGDEIRQSGANSIPEALRLVPGVIVREKTPGNYDVHIRGNDNIPPRSILLYSENSMALVMINGRPVYNYAFGGTFWETLPISVEDVARIEVIRGPSSALYGPNAVTGAINIVTREFPLDKPQVTASYSAGNALSFGNAFSHSAHISASVPAGKVFSGGFSTNFQRYGRFHETLMLIDSNKYYPVSYLATLPNIAGGSLEPDLLRKVSHPERSTNQMGANVFLHFNPSKQLDFNLDAGAQQSDNLTNILGNHEIPFQTRYSLSKYIDFRSKAYGFDIQTNYQFGDQDVERYNPGFHFDFDILNTILEYSYTFKSLTVRPGISYQQAKYSDAAYVNVENKAGYLNGEKNLNTLAYYLRADYKAFDKLRLIAAVRSDKYNKPDKTYLTYQFIGTFDINRNNMVRAVYSRANRGPFMADTYSDYSWEYVPIIFTMYWKGNENLQLPVMDMLEFGYRVKPIRNIQADFEFFRTVTSHYTYFMPIDMTLRHMEPIPYPIITANVQYRNFDLTATQTGASANISVAVSEQLDFKVFGTWQQTELKDFYPLTTFDVLDELMVTLPDSANPVVSSVANFDSTINLKHTATPSVYGGAAINWRPFKRLSVNSSIYFYSKQTFEHVEATVDIPAKTIVNLQVSYKVWRENEVFVNGRNLLGDDSVQFAYADRIGASIYLGFRARF